MRNFKYISIILILTAFMFGQVRHSDQRDDHLHMPFMTWDDNPENLLEGDINDFCMDTVNAVLYWKATEVTATTGWVVFTPTAIADADYGEITVASGTWTVDDDIIGSEHFKDQDWGEITVASGVASINDGVLNDEFIELGDAFVGDVGGTYDATVIGADKILESMLKAVNVAVDEDILTFEVTTGDYEWHTPAELGIVTTESDPIWVAAESNYGHLNQADNILANWVNTSFPWAADEIVATVIHESELAALETDPNALLTAGTDNVKDTHIDYGTGAGQHSAVDVPIADAGIIITATEVEGALQENRTAIDLNTAKVTNTDDQKIDVFSGSGNTISISLEDDGEANKTLDISGFTAIAANTAKNTNVSTALSIGTVTATTYGITSDGGADDIVLPEATTSTAGLLGADKWDEIVANSLKVTNTDDQTIDVSTLVGNTISISLEDDGEASKTFDISTATAVAANTAKNTNVPTALSVGTVGINTVAITSDGGADDVTLPAATVSTAGMLTTAKWAEIVANNAKVTNADHTGDVTGSTALTIAAASVDIAMLSATGTPSGTSFLRGDNVWATPAGAGNVSTSGTPVQYDFARFTNATDIEGRSYSEVKTDLGLVIGTDVQAYDAGLLSLAGLTYVSDSFIKMTAGDTYAVRTLAETLGDLSGVASGAFSFNDQNITNVGRIEADVIAADDNIMLTVEDSTNFSDDVNIAGTLGVGTTSPSAPLHITSATNPVIKSERTTSETNVTRNALQVNHITDGDMADGFGVQIAMGVEDATSGSQAMARISAYRDGADSEGAIGLFAGTSGNEQFLTIKSSGNVGIGTASPARKLNLYDASANIYQRMTTGGVNGYAGIELGNDAITWTSGVIASDDFVISDGVQFSGDAIFTLQDGTPANTLFVESTGNVGIGIATPDGTLHAHTATAGSVTPNTTVDDLVVENSDHAGITLLVPDNKLGQIYFGTPSTEVGARVAWDYGAAGANQKMMIGTNTASGIIEFQTASLTTAMTIDASQNVDIVGTLTATEAFVTLDNDTNDHSYVPMVLHGTDATPPAASGFPRGTIYIQYTP